MKYILLVYHDENKVAAMSDTERRALRSAYWTYVDDLRAHNAFVGNQVLQPTPTATTVSIAAGRTLTTDGPYIETKEQIGGFFVIDVHDLDDAIAWAAKVPDVELGGSVEVRPLFDLDTQGA